ncbi:hypothetical protein N7528_009248 [Penicillium herquei]|nr:hypothetical protein N7528_009248 [Penicillium herquei]
MLSNIDEADNLARMERGELYYAFSPQLVAARKRCGDIVRRLNRAEELTRRELAEYWKEYVDYGTNIRVGSNVFINFNCTFLDTCIVSIGSRTLVGPNVCFFSGTHPLDPHLRNGTNGPEMGRPITIGEDCWIAGNVILLPGVTIGNGCTIGAGSVVTKDVPAYHVAAGNPAKILRKIEPSKGSKIAAVENSNGTSTREDSDLKITLEV